MALKETKFTVLITFDITVDGRTEVYSKVTKQLADNGFTKESPSGVELPENVYYGVIARPVEFDDEGHVSVGELKSASDSISARVIELLEQIFDINDVQNKMLVHVGRKSTSTTVIK
ncbi:hypothetical protein [Pectobacterium zantedeschiae]|uniref:Uncharacterized protein n=1 Tax=Pectobacterium zantedeschiae TaxID=2034769 RepID=A0A9X8JJ06_9GAMM|nr:hypothetical protein [Pectobacterium zantedeschiae]RYC44618.1 hypothetical protein CLR69_06265 [Pectobacterium zantedeschiae]RYC49776.1 hypothetical protein CTN06_02070 [Pectobacterium zantedeschiae]